MAKQTTSTNPMIMRKAHGTTIPALGFGTWQLKGDECQRSVHAALETGYRHIDTAQAYENEAEIGRVLNESGIPREELFLTTKIWREQLDAVSLQTSFEQSLDRLQTDYVDLLLIHWDNDEIPMDETLQAMNDLQDEGRVKQIGVSNFTVPRLHAAIEASRSPIFTNQIEYHPFLGQADIRAYCLSKHILLTAYCPIARGEVMKNEEISKIAEEHGKSPAQVTLRWLLQQEQVVAIPKSSDPQHIRSNFDIFDFSLSAEEMNQIYRLERNQRIIDPDFAPDWDKEKRGKMGTEEKMGTEK